MNREVYDPLPPEIITYFLQGADMDVLNQMFAEYFQVMVEEENIISYVEIIQSYISIVYSDIVLPEIEGNNKSPFEKGFANIYGIALCKQFITISSMINGLYFDFNELYFVIARRNFDSPTFQKLNPFLKAVFKIIATTDDALYYYYDLFKNMKQNEGQIATANFKRYLNDLTSYIAEYKAKKPFDNSRWDKINESWKEVCNTILRR